MANRGHANADQIVGGQLRQHLAIDIVVAEYRRVLFKPPPAQPRHYFHEAILGSEERQPLNREDIFLPFGLRAAALKYAPSSCRGSRLQAVNQLLSSLGITGRPNQECCTQPSRLDCRRAVGE